MKKKPFVKQFAMIMTLQLGVAWAVSAQSNETGYVKFSGKDQSKVIGPIFDFAGSQITVEGWVRYNGPETSATLSNFYLFRNQGASNVAGFSLRYHKAGLYLNFGGSDGKWFNASKIVIDNKTWNHIALTFTDNAASLYINGALISTTTATNSYTNTDSRFLAIGNLNNSVSATGGATNVTDSMSFADVRVWNYARTSQEIAANFQQLVAFNSTGLQLNYNFANLTSESPKKYVYDEVTGRKDSVQNPYASSSKAYSWGKIGSKPTNLAVSNKTATGFDLTFDSSDDNKWEIELTDSQTAVSYDTVAVKTRSFTDLTKVSYTVRIRSIWPLISEWSEPLPVSLDIGTELSTPAMNKSITVRDGKIVVNCPNYKNLKAEIFSVAGQKLYEETLRSQFSTFDFPLKSGVYLVKIGNETSKLAVK